MSYLVLAYPILAQNDYNFIQEYRKANDPRYYSLVNPHFTIVFSTNKLVEEEFVDEITKQSKSINKFDFEIKVATINFDDSKTFYHEFLVPDKGNSEIIKLHNQLYSEKLSDEVRYDIDFIPHIGIGNNDDLNVCKNRIAKLNSQNINICGTVSNIDIVKYDQGKIRTIKQLDL